MSSTLFIKIIIILFIISLFLKILSSLINNKILKYIFTPLTTFLIIVIPLINYFSNNSIYTLYIFIGLIFSLIGDIFNMIEKEDNSQLIFGILAFLTAHIFYIFAFLVHYTFYFNQLFFAALLLPIIIFAFIILKKDIKIKILKYGILIYIFVVSTMLFIAMGTLKNTLSIKTVLVPVGATLFWLSDLLLGIDAFYKKLKFNILIIWGLYAPAQLLIALSTL